MIEKPDVTCTRCDASIHWLEVFPGDVCLECHAKAWKPNPNDFAYIRTMGQVQ